MNTTKIYLIRHGQSKANELDVFLGHSEMDLTETGYLQAEKTAQFLSDKPIDVIYSSDLMRAYHTACATAKIKHLDITKNPNLREIYAGKWEKQPFVGLAEAYPEDFAVWLNDIGNARCTGGESVKELQERFVSEVEKLAKENVGKTICIFAHATPIRVLAAAWQNTPLNQISAIPWPTNASVTEAEYADGHFRIIEYSIDHFMGDMVTALPSNV